MAKLAATALAVYVMYLFYAAPQQPYAASVPYYIDPWMSAGQVQQVEAGARMLEVMGFYLYRTYNHADAAIWVDTTTAGCGMKRPGEQVIAWAGGCGEVHACSGVQQGASDFAHELAHVLGVDHVPEGAGLMYAYKIMTLGFTTFDVPAFQNRRSGIWDPWCATQRSLYLEPPEW